MSLRTASEAAGSAARGAQGGPASGGRTPGSGSGACRS